MFILLNLLLTVLMTWFTQSVYTGLPSSGLWIILIFFLWYTVFWLLSFFYNRKAFYRTPKIIMLIFFYFRELFIASLRVAKDVLKPNYNIQPAVIAVPLEARTDLEITLLANLVTLTPGTLSIDVSEDRTTLYIHELYVENGNPDITKNRIKEGFERKILSVTRM